MALDVVRVGVADAELDAEGEVEGGGDDDVVRAADIAARIEWRAFEREMQRQPQQLMIEWPGQAVEKVAPDM